MKQHILEIKKFIPNEFCKKIISYFDQELEVAAIVGGVANRDIRNCEIKDMMKPKTFGENIMSKYVQSKIFEAAAFYRENVHKHFDPTQISQCDLLKYECNSHKVGYDFHVDMGYGALPRQLSVSICLNNDFKGGEFVFDLPDEKIQYPQNVGDLIAFPSNFLFPHQVNKVTEGTRYAVVSWVV